MEYFTNLYNVDHSVQIIDDEDTSESNGPKTEENSSEIISALLSLKNRKAPGIDKFSKYEGTNELVNLLK